MAFPELCTDAKILEPKGEIEAKKKFHLFDSHATKVQLTVILLLKQPFHIIHADTACNYTLVDAVSYNYISTSLLLNYTVSVPLLTFGRCQFNFESIHQLPLCRAHIIIAAVRESSATLPTRK